MVKLSLTHVPNLTHAIDVALARCHHGPCKDRVLIKVERQTATCKAPLSLGLMVTRSLRARVRLSLSGHAVSLRPQCFDSPHVSRRYLFEEPPEPPRRLELLVAEARHEDCP